MMRPAMSEEIGAITAALIRFRRLVGTLETSKTVEVSHKSGGKHDFRYTDAAAQFAATLDPLEECGLAVSQPTDMLFTPNGQSVMVVRTLIGHAESGQWIAGVTPILTVSAGMQGYNAALSSARRVGLNAALGLVSGDKEDGAGYDARKARAAPRGKKEQPSAEPYLRAVHDALDIEAVKVAVGLGRHALEGWPSVEIVDQAAVAWFKARLDKTSEQAEVEAITAALRVLNLRGKEALAASFRAAAGRVPKPGQVPS